MRKKQLKIPKLRNYSGLVSWTSLDRPMMYSLWEQGNQPVTFPHYKMRSLSFYCGEETRADVFQDTLFQSLLVFSCVAGPAGSVALPETHKCVIYYFIYSRDSALLRAWCILRVFFLFFFFFFSSQTNSSIGASDPDTLSTYFILLLDGCSSSVRSSTFWSYFRILSYFDRGSENSIHIVE